MAGPFGIYPGTPSRYRQQQPGMAPPAQFNPMPSSPRMSGGYRDSYPNSYPGAIGGAQSAPAFPMVDPQYLDQMNRMQERSVGRQNASANFSRSVGINNGVLPHDTPIAGAPLPTPAPPTYLMGGGSRSPYAIPGNATIAAPGMAGGGSRSGYTSNKFPGMADYNKALGTYGGKVVNGAYVPGIAKTPEDAMRLTDELYARQYRMAREAAGQSQEIPAGVASPAYLDARGGGSPALSMAPPAQSPVTQQQPAQAPAPHVTMAGNSVRDPNANKIQLTEQHAREVWRLAQQQDPNAAQEHFASTLSGYGIDHATAMGLLEKWSQGGTLQGGGGFGTINQGTRVPLSMLGPGNGLAGAPTPPMMGPEQIAGRNSSPFLPPQVRQSVPGPSIQTPATFTPGPQPGYTPIADAVASPDQQNLMPMSLTNALAPPARPAQPQQTAQPQPQQPAPAAQPAQAAPQFSEQDIQHTMQVRGMTREQVLAALSQRGG